MKYYLLCLLFLLTEAATAQIDHVQTRITYEYDYLTANVSGEVMRKDRMILNIGQQTSSFYSNYNNMINNLRDSLLEKGYSLSEINTQTGKIPKSNLNFQLFKNYPSKDKCLYVDRLFSEYYKYEEELEKPDWKMVNEKKEVLGYSCQKATASFRGRKWIAWFTTEIPISDGPWKLWGLPGLILEASDEENLFHFTAIGLEKVADGIPIREIQEQYITCTREEFFKIRKDFWKNPSAYVSRIIGGDFKISASGSNGARMDTGFDYIDIEADPDK